MENYEIVELLEQSTRSRLYQVINKTTNKEYAMKAIDKSKAVSKLYNKDLNVFKTICKVQHSNIIKYEKSFNNDKDFVIIMEYCKGKCLVI